MSTVSVSFQVHVSCLDCAVRGSSGAVAILPLTIVAVGDRALTSDLTAIYLEVRIPLCALLEARDLSFSAMREERINRKLAVFFGNVIGSFAVPPTRPEGRGSSQLFVSPLHQGSTRCSNQGWTS